MGKKSGDEIIFAMSI